MADIRSLMMKRRQIYYTIVLISLICIINSVDGSGTESTPLAKEFILLDQYGRRYEINYPQEKVCVLVFADKWGCTQVEGWVRPLYEHYEDTIDILGVAQLENVPGWLRSTIVRIFKNNIEFSVMMDWTGQVSRAYEYSGGKAYVVIICRQGIIRHRVKGKASEELIEKCAEVIQALKTGTPGSVSPDNPAVEKTQSDTCQQGPQYALRQGDKRKKDHYTKTNPNNADSVGPRISKN